MSRCRGRSEFKGQIGAQCDVIDVNYAETPIVSQSYVKSDQQHHLKNLVTVVGYTMYIEL